MNKKLRSISEVRKHAEGRDVNGRNLLVLHRPSDSALTFACPFCGDQHQHGEGNGHRVAHCVTTDCNYVIGDCSVFKNENGQIFDSKDGYIVESLN